MSKIVLYGAGKRGQAIYNFLEANGYADAIWGFCDRNAKKIGKIGNKMVWLPNEIMDNNVIYCITLLDVEKKRTIRGELGEEKCIDFSDLATALHVDRVKFNRDFCAFYHVDDMDSYFQSAENEIDIFWSQNSEFYQMFQKLDTTNIIELACGRGRHVLKYFDKAEQITLVDILQKNIDFCKERFGKEEKIKFYKNDGYDLKELESDAYSSLFCYDAMVHFELIDIYTYLKDIYRVLKAGGGALIHHSNYHADYKADFSNAPHSRNFMSRECFAYLAYRAGFVVLEQKVIDWQGTKDLDCITLLEKVDI